MDRDQILRNAIRFVDEAIIVGGHGYEFKQAMRFIFKGADYDEVKSWYDTQLKGGSNEE